MSYDYYLFRARAPIRSAEDVDTPNLRTIGTYKEIRSLFTRVHPDIRWSDEGEYGHVKTDSEDITILCSVDGPIHLYLIAKVWWKDDFRTKLIAFAKAAGLFVFDPQKGELVGGQLEPET